MSRAPWIFSLALALASIASAQTAADGQAAFARGDLVAAERIWRPLAEQGDAGAQVGLGNLHMQGKVVAQDFAAAAQWYQRAAQRNSALAQFNLGSMYLRGSGVPHDEGQATQWFRLAAEQGYAPAQTRYALQLESGSGVAKDEAQAAIWYRRAALQSDTVALANLGSLYDEGRGVARNAVLGSALLMAAASAAPARQDIAKLSTQAQSKLSAPERDAASALSRKMAQAGGLASALDPGVSTAEARARPPAGAAGSVPVALSGGCAQYTVDGEVLLPPSRPVPCANAMVVTVLAGGGLQWDVRPPGLRPAAIVFKQAQQLYPPTAELFIASVNGRPVAAGNCGFQPVRGQPGAASLGCSARDEANRTTFEFSLLLDDRREFVAGQTRWAKFFDAMEMAFNALGPETPYVRPREEAPAPGGPTVAAGSKAGSNVGGTAGNAGTRLEQPVFGLRVGEAFPRGLPACSNEVRGLLGTGWLAAPTRQASLCVGATEGGLNRSPNRRIGNAELIPILPSDAALQREFPELADFMLGNHVLFVLVDDAKILRGIIITSTVMNRTERLSAKAMLDRRYGSDPEEQRRTVNDKSISGGAIQVTFSNWIWRSPKVVVRLGPPEGKPQADQVQILVFSPELSSAFSVR